jgi:hypothetical protein
MEARDDANRRSSAAHEARTLRDRIAQEGSVWSSAIAAGLDARIAALEAKPGAAARIEESERTFAEADMPLHASALRRLRGELVGGDAGATLIRDADAGLRERGVADPARMAEILIW